MASTPGPVYPPGPRPGAPIQMRTCNCPGCFRGIPDGVLYCVPCTERVGDDGVVIPAWHGPGGQHGYGGDLDAAPAVPRALLEAITLVDQCVGGYDLSEDVGWPPDAELRVQVSALRALRVASRFLYQPARGHRGS